MKELKGKEALAELKLVYLNTWDGQGFVHEFPKLEEEYKEEVDAIEKDLKRLEEFERVLTADQVCEILQNHYRKSYNNAEVRYVVNTDRELSRGSSIVYETIEKMFIVNFSSGYKDYAQRDCIQVSHIIYSSIDFKNNTKEKIKDSVLFEHNFFSLPPHLITLIGRFYEGECK